MADYYQLNIKLLPGPDDDLIAWHQAMATRSASARADAVRAALRRGALGSQCHAPEGGIDQAALADFADEMESRMLNLLLRVGFNPDAAMVQAAVQAEKSDYLRNFDSMVLGDDEEDV